MQKFLNALEYNVYHRCLCYFLNQTEANLLLAIFQSARFLCNGCRMTFHSMRSFITREISLFALLIGRTVLHNEIVVRVPDWLHLESVRILCFYSI